MAHGITLTLRAIQPRERMFWNSKPDPNEPGRTYRAPENTDKLPRAVHRNYLFGRKAVGNTTPVERKAILDAHTRIVQATE